MDRKEPRHSSILKSSARKPGWGGLFAVSARAQTILEYMLLMALVAFIVFQAFRPTGLLEQTQGKIRSYFSKGAAAVMGSAIRPDGVYVDVNPAPIQGGWCAWTTCINGVRTRECACPRPAFGGVWCPGPAVDYCG